MKFNFGNRADRRVNRYELLISEKFHVWPVIRRTIFFTSEKNCVTNQIVSFL